MDSTVEVDMSTGSATAPCPNCAYPVPLQLENCPECGASAENCDAGRPGDVPRPLEGEIAPAVHTVAVELMRNGASAQQVGATLIEKGIDEKTAAAVVADLTRLRSEAVREAGRKNMVFGALWCGGGIAVTAATYGAASSSGGGSYVVAWGAIIFGAIQFGRGLIQSGSRESD
jgi:hypothetical protein